MLKNFLNWIILVFLLVFHGSCEDYEKDFTSGNFYPVTYTENEGEEEVDTTNNNDFEDPRDCWDSGISAIHNEYFNNLFTRYEDGWTGGDATYSINVDENRNLWIFGDTFLGTVREDRTRPFTKLINNSIVLQEGDFLTTYFQGLENDPRSFLSPPEEDWWYWPGHGIAKNDTLQLIMYAMKRTNEGGQFGFEYASIDLAKISLPGMEIISLDRKMNFQGANFGAFIMTLGEYSYLYGAYKSGFNKYLHVARVQGTDLSADWEYYKGDNTWTNEVVESVPIFANVSEQFSIIQRLDKFYLMTQNYFLGAELYLYSGSGPTGPFENEQTIYCTPETNDRIFTYNAFVHDQFSSENDLLISYNNNSRYFADLFSDSDNYRPHFVNIKDWIK